MQKENFKVAGWVTELVNSGEKSFFKISNGRKLCYDIPTKTFKPIPGTDNYIILENYSEEKNSSDKIVSDSSPLLERGVRGEVQGKKSGGIVWKNSGTRLTDIGDGVLNLEFRTKMNSIGSEVLEAVHKSIEIAEKDFRGLVIGNDGANFSAGANLAMMLMLAIDQEYDELEFAARIFQNTSMRIRYSAIPVVVAPHHLTLGGGCEFTLHADRVVAGAETYIGLVEFGIGIIPAGGGSKEMTLRASDAYAEGEIEFPELQKRYMSIATAKVATSAAEAFDMDILKHGRDHIVLNQSRLIAEAKNAVLALSHAGYTMPAQRTNITVLGRSALGAFYTGINAMLTGGYISAHDKLVSEKLAFVMCGGDLTSPQTVSEQYLLDLEREAFLSLVTTKKTMERIKFTLETGKPLRN